MILALPNIEAVIVVVCNHGNMAKITTLSMVSQQQEVVDTSTSQVQNLPKAL